MKRRVPNMHAVRTIEQVAAILTRRGERITPAGVWTAEQKALEKMRLRLTCPGVSVPPLRR